MREFKRGLLPFLIVLGPVAMLILFEPALSMALSVCLLAGIVLFSGSIYLLVLTPAKWLGPVTPIGGLFLIAGWISMLLVANAVGLARRAAAAGAYRGIRIRCPSPASPVPRSVGC